MKIGKETQTIRFINFSRFNIHNLALGEEFLMIKFDKVFFKRDSNKLFSCIIWQYEILFKPLEELLKVEHLNLKKHQLEN